jgi:DNA-binding MarR family transcriptional regulator
MVNPDYPVFYDLDNYRPDDNVGYLMRLILSSMAHDIDAQLAGSDLTNAQWLPMLKLHQGHASTVAELARACNLDTGAMTRLLDRLEAKGLCKRIRSETDRRVVNIALTENGREVAHGIPQVLCSVLNQHLTGLNVDEFSNLKNLLQRVLSNTSRAGAAHTPLALLSQDADCAPAPLSSLATGNSDAL